MAKKLLPFAIWIALPVIILLFPNPEGLTPRAWTLLAFYVALIVGLILRPIPEPAVGLVVVAAYSLIYGDTGTILAGYSNGVVWLVFTACLVGKAFIDTGLGSRVAYGLIKRFGSTTLRLLYVGAVTDLILSPATPSNTARSGGIIFPVLRSISTTFGSEPGPTSRKFGAYMTMATHATSLTTAAMFLTSNSANLLIASFAKTVFGVEISWGMHALAMSVPCLVILFLFPWLIYKLYPPTIQAIDNHAIADEGLAKLGPVSGREKMLAILFVTALVLWSTGFWTKISATSVALFFVAGTLFFKIISWDSMAQEKAGLTTFMWYGAILSLATALTKEGFFKWLGAILGTYVNLKGMNPVLVMVLMVAASLPLRYFFASVAAYCGSMMPVYMVMAQVAEVPPLLASFSLFATYLFGCLLTHYGNGVSPVLFGPGYVDQKTWWGYGIILALISTTLVLAIGIPWWKILGYW